MYYNFKRHRWPLTFHQSYFFIFSYHENRLPFRQIKIVPILVRKKLNFKNHSHRSKGPKSRCTLSPSKFRIVGERYPMSELTSNKRCRNRSPRTGIADFQSTTRPRTTNLGGNWRAHARGENRENWRKINRRRYPSGGRGRTRIGHTRRD